MHPIDANRRQYKRHRPADPGAVLLLSDGTTVPCRVLDVSRSGAAISAETLPAVGEPLAVGQIIGRVIRHLNGGGFAVQFLEVQDEDKLDALLRAKQIPPRDA